MANKTTLLATVIILFSPLAMPQPAGIKAHKPGEFIDSIQNDPLIGQKVYQEFCSLCHALEPSIPINAPRIGVKTEWAKRQERGFQHMYENLDAGIGAMPARGGCFECTDEMLKAAMEYMLPKPENP